MAKYDIMCAMENLGKVAVLMGGASSEREVSLISGRNVAEALTSLGGRAVVSVVLDGNSLPPLPEGTSACYIALHGGWGENGGVQAALDALGVPYTGPGAAASRVAMDKIATKRVLDEAGVPTAKWTSISSEEAARAAAQDAGGVGFPCVVKAPREGSSVGVYIVKDPSGFCRAVDDARRIDREKFGGDGEALVEAFVPGREMTVAVLAGEPLPVVEICAPNGWYGYEEKYNSNETRYVFPDDAYLPEMQRLARASFDAVGCRGIARVDFRVTDDGRMYVLELNTSPGMTGHSLVPKAAAKVGLDFAHLCDRVVRSAAHD